MYSPSGGAWVNRTPRQVRRTGVDGSTPGGICNSVIVVEIPSPFLIGIVATSPPCDLDASQQVANKRQSTSPVLSGNTQKLDAIVDGNLPDDINSASILRKVIDQKLSDGSSGDLYTHCKINFVADPVQT